MDVHFFEKITLKEIPLSNVNSITVFSLSKVLHQQFIIPLVIYTQQTLSNLNQFWQNERKRIDLIKRPVMMVIMEILKALPLYQYAYLFVALHLVWFYNIGINLRVLVRVGAMGAVAPVNFWTTGTCTRQFLDLIFPWFQYLVNILFFHSNFQLIIRDASIN